MKAIITGGGTGGHIYPAIAIADEIKKREPESEILYIGNEIGLEKDIVPRSGYDIRFVSAKWIDRRNIFKIADTGFHTLRGIVQAHRIMKKFKPEVVVGTGGYVCFPVIYAAHRLGVRCYIHEQNAFPGMANKALERFVDKIFLGFPEAGAYFKEPEKHVVTGNPVREEFFGSDRAVARKKLEIPAEAFVVFVFGGSQGSEAVNYAMFDLIDKVSGSENIYLLFATGSMYYDEVMEKMSALGIKKSERIRISPYVEDMAGYIAAADIVVGRSGALSVAEICVSGRAAVMIPSPNVTGNHQFFNAKSVADKGGAVIIEERDLTPGKLADTVLNFEKKPEILAEMEKRSRNAVPDNGTEKIYECIREDLS